MSANSSSSVGARRRLFGKAAKVVGLLLWVVISFAAAQAVWLLVGVGLEYIGVPLLAVNKVILHTIVAVLVYLLALVIVIGVPWWAKKSRTSLKVLGIDRLPSWLDIGMSPLGFIVYLLITAVLTWAAAAILPGFDPAQAQDTGFGQLGPRYEYMLAFGVLVVLAPLAEEVLFRGYLYGKLRHYVPIWAAVILTSVLFGFVHGQWNVGVDVFALSIILCSLREATGSIWAGVLVHMIKNSIAYYLLFVNPSLLL